jgi:replicative DNA helicase
MSETNGTYTTRHERERSAPTAAPVMRLGDLIGTLRDDATEAYEARVSGQLRGPVTRIPLLDDALGGALQPGVHVLHAGSGVGKTALALQIAATCGFPALFVTCEMAPLELLRRHTARVTNTFLGRLKSGEYEPGRVVSLAEAACLDAPDLALMDATMAPALASNMVMVARAMQGDHRSVLVVVDSLHSWASGGAFAEGDEYARLAVALSDLRGAASQLAAPVLVIAERNRASMKKGGLNAGAGHRGVEYGAESVWGLDKEDDATRGHLGDLPVKLTIEKNRNGALGRPIDLSFYGATMKFVGA